MNTFLKLSQYFAVLDALLHIGQQAMDAVAAGDTTHPSLDRLAAHIDAFVATVDAVTPIAGKVVGDVAQAVAIIKPPQV